MTNKIIDTVLAVAVAVGVWYLSAKLNQDAIALGILAYGIAQIRNNR